MTLRVWWAYEGSLGVSKFDERQNPVVLLSDLREVVEGLKSVRPNRNGDYYNQALDDLLAQLKGVGDE